MAKKKTAAQGIDKSIKRTAQETIPILSVLTDDGIIEIAPGLYSKSYAFDDINYQIAQETEQEEMFEKYRDFLNTFDANVSLQITLNSRNLDQQKFSKTVLLRETGDNLDELRREYNEKVLLKKIQEGRNSMRRERYLTLTIAAAHPQEAIVTFQRLDGDVIAGMKRIGGTEAKPLKTKERIQILHDIYNLGSEEDFTAETYDFRKMVERGLSVKDYIAPPSFEFSSSHFKTGDKFARALYLRDLPTSLHDNILADLTNVDFNMLLTINMRPIAQEKALALVRNQVVSINAAVVDAQKKATKAGYSPELISPSLRQAQQEATELQEDLTQRNQKMFFNTLTMVLFADSLEELKEETEEIQSIARKHMCTIKVVAYQQEAGFNATLPLGNCTLSMSRPLTSESSAVFMPFTSQELNQQHGMYYGTNAVSHNLILFNRLNCKNSNGIILGQPGCVDCETEFFNGSEWKSVADYIPGEMVLQFNTETDEATLVQPTRYIKEKCDKMYHFETKYGINQTLSAEHRVIYYPYHKRTKSYGAAKEMYADELAVKQNAGKFYGRFKTDFEYGGPGIDMSNVEIELMLAVIADGSFNKNNPDSLNCTFRLKKTRKKQALIALLNAAGIEFHMNSKSDGFAQISFQAPRREKTFLPYWYQASKEQLQLICDAVLCWDGHEDAIGRKAFSTTVKENADFVQFAFSACGYRATISVNDRTGRIKEAAGKQYTVKSVEYTVCISSHTMVGMYWHHDGRENNVMMEEVVPADGYKYCFTVPTHALVLRRNGKIFITGNSGKSFAAKREMLNVLLNTDADVIVIDPESEYGPMAELLGGEVIKIKTGGDVHINPMDMDMAYSSDEGGDPLALKSDFLLSLCETIMGGRYGLTPIQKSIIDRCVREVYQTYLATGRKSDIPTLHEFHDALARQPDPEAREIAISLEIYVKGSLKIFASPTNVDTDNRFIVYDVRDMGANVKTMAMQIVLDSLWNRICANRNKGRRTWFYVDEIYLLFSSENSAAFLQQLWKRARKYGGVPTGITQNVEDLLKSETARTMLSNSDFVMMLNQATLDASTLADLLHISSTQLSYITNADPGQGLLYIASNGAGQGGIIPFNDRFPTDTKLFKVMNTQMAQKSNSDDD